MKKIIHQIDKNNRRIHLLHPPKKNYREMTTKRFTTKEKATTKAKFKEFKREHREAWLDGRDKLIQAIAGTKFTPSYELKVTLQAQ